MLYFLVAFFFSDSQKQPFHQDDFENQQDSSIYWCEDRKLSWADFRAVPGTSDFKAMTYSSVPVELKISSKYGIIGYKVSAIFMRDSWSSTDDYSSLKHEQLHFDISELYARKIRRTIKFNMRLDQDQIMKLINLQVLALYDTQSKYDEVTAHGTNLEKQDFWADSIYRELNILSGFKGDYECK